MLSFQRPHKSHITAAFDGLVINYAMVLMKKGLRFRFDPDSDVFKIMGTTLHAEGNASTNTSI